MNLEVLPDEQALVPPRLGQPARPATQGTIHAGRIGANEYTKGHFFGYSAFPVRNRRMRRLHPAGVHGEEGRYEVSFF